MSVRTCLQGWTGAQGDSPGSLDPGSMIDAIFLEQRSMMGLRGVWRAIPPACVVA